MNKDHLLKLLCSVYTQEISADDAFDELEDLIDRIKRLEEESESRWNLAESAIASCDEMASRIKRLEEAGDALYIRVSCGCGMAGPCKCCRDAEYKWDEAKEAKP